MLKISLIIAFICTLPFSSGHLTIPDEDHTLLPPVYGMEDFKQCAKKKNIYCTADIKLDSFYKNSSTWKLIEKRRRDRFLYNHDIIHRAVCVPKMYENKPEEIKYFATNVVSKEIEKLNLTLATVNVTCNQKFNAGTTDNILLYLICSYFIIIISTTLYDLITRRKNGSVKGNHILEAFSLGNSYKKIFYQNRGKDYQKLKCIQGLRTLCSILTIWTHTLYSYNLSFIKDTKYVEHMLEFRWVHYVLTFTFFIMQIFFLISAWLLTIQVLDIFETNKKFTLKDAVLLFINRCFRFWPALLFALSFQRKVFTHKLSDVPLPGMLDTCDNACQNYWYASLLFVNNHLKLKDMCYVVTWYLSADIQLHAISLAILYSMLKFKSAKNFLGFCLFMSYVYFGLIIYWNDLDVVFRPSPEGMKWKELFNDSNFSYLYSMTHVNSTTYILGICFGTFYCRLRDSQVSIKKNFLPILNLSFLVLPPLAIVTAAREFKGLSAALVGPLLKPMFSLGIGMGILGMSQSTGGIKKVFEWRPLEFLSQFTFCGYMYHFLLVSLRFNFMQQPLNMSHGILITSAIQDAVCGFLIAFVMHLSVELPWTNIQKIYLPQVKKRALKSE